LLEVLRSWIGEPAGAARLSCWRTPWMCRS